MSEQASRQNMLENLWMQEGVWRRSTFARDFLKRARAQYPIPQNGSKAAWPEDEEGIAQNLSYFFTGHLLKINKILCTLLGDEESINYLSQAREITVIDMACGAGMASVGLIDFIQQAMKDGIIQREAPLTVHFVLNDLNEPCVAAARKSIELVRQMLASKDRQLHIGSVHGYTGSVSGIVPFIKETQTRAFDLYFFCNAFDHVLMYGHKALEKDPQCSDPIAHARPCDRPALLAKLFQQLGTYANPYFSRNVLMQESRHCHLISVALPDRELKVTHTWMNQETDRPDVETPTMNVRFGYCGCKYGFSNRNFSSTPELQPLSGQDLFASSFSKESSAPSALMIS